jgi:hypothetical protein
MNPTHETAAPRIHAVRTLSPVREEVTMSALVSSNQIESDRTRLRHIDREMAQ